MLILKTDQEEGRLTIASARKNHRRQMRRQQLLAIFQTLRRNVVFAQSQVMRANGQKVVPLNGQVFLNYPQMHSAYFPYLSYVARATQPLIQLPVLPKYQNMGRNQAVKMIIMPERKQDVYFQREGYVVYRNLIGKGSYSNVWQGADVVTGEKVAVKEVKQLEQNEVKCLRELTSPHIIKVLSIFRHKSKTYIVLQFCEKNLREELMDCQYGLEQILLYFEQIVVGIDVLQSRNILHRDLKFENILIKQGFIKIADFGLAKFLGSELEVSSRRCGTPYTMAPEIYFSDSYKTPYTTKCDIWSIGVILHEMLYQKHPFKGNRQAFKQQQRIKVNRKFGILDRLIDECLVFNPALRIDWEQFKIIFLDYLKIKNSVGWIMVENMEAIAQPKINRVVECENVKVRVNQLQGDRKQQKYNFKKIKQQPINQVRREEKAVVVSPDHEKTDKKRNHPSKQVNYIKRQKKQNAHQSRKANQEVQRTAKKLGSKKVQMKGSAETKPVVVSLRAHQNVTFLGEQEKSRVQMPKLRLLIQLVFIGSVVCFFLLVL